MRTCERVGEKGNQPMGSGKDAPVRFRRGPQVSRQSDSRLESKEVVIDVRCREFTHKIIE